MDTYQGTSVSFLENKMYHAEHYQFELFGYDYDGDDDDHHHSSKVSKAIRMNQQIYLLIKDYTTVYRKSS